MEKRPMPVRRLIGSGVIRTKRFTRLNRVAPFAAEIDTNVSEVTRNGPSSSTRDSDAGPSAKQRKIYLRQRLSELEDIGDAGGRSGPPAAENQQAPAVVVDDVLHVYDAFF